MEIHPTAVIDPEARIGEDVEIGPYTVVKGDVEIGDGTRIGPHVVIEGRTRIGKGCQVYQFASIGAPPQDKKYKGEDTALVIGDNNIIREFTTINRGTHHGGGITEIGDGNLLMAYVHIAHDCRIGNGCVLANAATLAGHITIEDRAIVGGLVAIHQFVRVGKYSMIGGASAVTMDVTPYATVAGNRAKLFGINKVGLERAGFKKEEIQEIERAYRIIFRSGKILKDALSEVEREMGHNPDVRYLIDFIRASKRGITR